MPKRALNRSDAHRGLPLPHSRAGAAHPAVHPTGVTTGWGSKTQLHELARRGATKNHAKLDSVRLVAFTQVCPFFFGNPPPPPPLTKVGDFLLAPSCTPPQQGHPPKKTHPYASTTADGREMGKLGVAIPGQEKNEQIRAACGVRCAVNRGKCRRGFAPGEKSHPRIPPSPPQARSCPRPYLGQRNQGRVGCLIRLSDLEAGSRKWFRHLIHHNNACHGKYPQPHKGRQLHAINKHMSDRDCS